MAGLPWFAMSSDFPTHPKTVRLALRLKDPNAGMYVVRLLAFCADHAPTGRLDGEEVEAIVEAACEWKRKPRGGLVEALVGCGFLEAEGDAYLVHGWQERNGAHVRKREKDNARPNASRRKPAETQRPPSADPDDAPPEPRANTARTPRGVSSGPRAGEGEGEGERQSGSSLRSEPEAAAAREAAADELPAEGGGEAASPPAQPPAPSSPEELPERRLEIVPVVQGAHELGGELRRRLARGRGAPLLPLRDEAAADRLEAQLERLGPQGVQRAEAACRERERTWRGDEVASMAFFAAVVGDLEPAGEAETPTTLRDRALAKAAEACPLWGELALTAAEHMAPEFFLRFVAPVEASFDGEVLRLNGTTLESATWVGQQGPAIADGATRRNGDRRVLVHVDPVQARTAGGRP